MASAAYEGPLGAVGPPMRFPMTLGPLTKVITISSLVLMSVVLPIQFFVVLRVVPTPELKGALIALVCVLALVIPFIVAIAPRAVRISQSKLSVERLFWPDFELPLREVTGVEEGPPLSLFGTVRRVAGNGGVMGFTGLFHVSQVGLVRCWVTRLGTPTVVVHRTHAKPLLLGVDDPAGLLRELRRRSAADFRQT